MNNLNAATAVAHAAALSIEDLIDEGGEALEIHTVTGLSGGVLANTEPTERPHAFIVVLESGQRILVTCEEIGG